MPKLHPASLSDDELQRECALKRVKRSGPGGQRRNKVETGVVLRHIPTGIEAEASERRSQPENQRVAFQRLRIKLALDVRMPADPAGTPSALWTSRLNGERLAINPAHDDFPALLAEALNAVSDSHWEIKAAAEKLGCSASQLVKLLKREPLAFAMANRERTARGLRALK